MALLIVAVGLAASIAPAGAVAAQPAWAKKLFVELLSTPYLQKELPVGVRLVGINPLVPADGSPDGLVNVTLRSTHAPYSVLYDMQAGSGRWGAATLWSQIHKYATAGGSIAFHPTVGYQALCSYAELGVGLDISCSAWVRGVFVQVKPPRPVAKAQTNEVVAVLRSAIAHLKRVSGA